MEGLFIKPNKKANPLQVGFFNHSILNVPRKGMMIY